MCSGQHSTKGADASGLREMIKKKLSQKRVQPDRRLISREMDISSEVHQQGEVADSRGLDNVNTSDSNSHASTPLQQPQQPLQCEVTTWEQHMQLRKDSLHRKSVTEHGRKGAFQKRGFG